MDYKLELFLKLNKLFKDNGFKLYLVGGTVRDFLLGVELTDMDAVTDATPEEMKRFLEDANYTFEKYGSISIKPDKKVKFDITTMREETSYQDSRHPSEIRFVRDINIDVRRRDFTINALYLDENLKVIDLVDGQKDLENKVLRMIGDPNIRLKEDPLRIIRAIRFASDYQLSLDKDLELAIRNNVNELNNLNPDKITQDLRKCKPESKTIVLQYLQDFDIKLS